ncbi:hypothetical protein [Ponticaulis profundi]|uniref:Uncharacterized protein n=1 Tax=Ponticaulis profundi TaxID=2665222 RepID=A0ABW1SB18_9PROT
MQTFWRNTEYEEASSKRWVQIVLCGGWSVSSQIAQLCQTTKHGNLFNRALLLELIEKAGIKLWDREAANKVLPENREIPL